MRIIPGLFILFTSCLSQPVLSQATREDLPLLYFPTDLILQEEAFRITKMLQITTEGRTQVICRYLQISQKAKGAGTESAVVAAIETLVMYSIFDNRITHRRP